MSCDVEARPQQLGPLANQWSTQTGQADFRPWPILGCVFRLVIRLYPPILRCKPPLFALLGISPATGPWIWFLGTGQVPRKTKIWSLGDFCPTFECKSTSVLESPPPGHRANTKGRMCLASVHSCCPQSNSGAVASCVLTRTESRCQVQFSTFGAKLWSRLVSVPWGTRDWFVCTHSSLATELKSMLAMEEDISLMLIDTPNGGSEGGRVWQKEQKIPIFSAKKAKKSQFFLKNCSLNRVLENHWNSLNRVNFT